MEWEPRQPLGPRMSRPEDGIVTGGRELGWLGERWHGILHEKSQTHANRLARGRSLARGGRVRDLWFAPGLANAEVVDSQAFKVSLRVRVLEDHEWAILENILSSRLIHVARLMEGELPVALVEEAAKAGLQLFPAQEEIDGDCDCSDYMVPCSHIAAVHNVVAEALDGDPFLLLTLRGRGRDHVMAVLRERWGDDVPLDVEESGTEEEPAIPGDWLHSPASLPRMGFRFRQTEGAAPGLLTLGPPPGRADLLPPLEPLYQAGAEAALELAHAESSPGESSRKRKKWYSQRERLLSGPPSGLGDGQVTVDMTLVEEEEGPMGRSRSKSTKGRKAPPPPDLTEALVDHLAQVECAKSKELADALGTTIPVVRAELIELEKLGVVYRTGQTRGTRWWLG